MKPPTEIEIPFTLTHNPRDKRGLPIPYIVFRDDAGYPHFTVNDVIRTRKVLHKKLCGLCGRLHKANSMWFIGGAGAAFHERGLYLDPPVCEFCGRYAIRVCPFIAAPRYSKRIEDRTLKPDDLKQSILMVDDTVDVDRPPFFVLSRASGFRLVNTGSMNAYIQPKRPWKVVEFWCKGEQIAEPAARELLKGTGYEVEGLMWWPKNNYPVQS